MSERHSKLSKGHHPITTLDTSSVSGTYGSGWGRSVGPSQFAGKSWHRDWRSCALLDFFGYRALSNHRLSFNLLHILVTSTFHVQFWIPSRSARVQPQKGARHCYVRARTQHKSFPVQNAYSTTMTSGKVRPWFYPIKLCYALGIGVIQEEGPRVEGSSRPPRGW